MANAIPCTRFTRNNPGCRCQQCLVHRGLMKRDRRKDAAIGRVMTQDRRKRAAPWEGAGRRD